jgi:CubicO group peptidase (beta-lactamase class C family)
LVKEELFDPLGNFDVALTRRLHNGYPLVAAGLEARPRDWTKLGQLVLNHGAWHGKQIVSSSWIDLSTTAAKFTPISDGSPSRMSYGFQWWVGRSNFEGRVIDWAAAVGFNSQKIIIAPALDLVVVFNASSQSKEAPAIVLLVKYVLPAILKP